MTQSLYLLQQIWPHFTPKEVPGTSISKLFKMGQCHRCDLKNHKYRHLQFIYRVDLLAINGNSLMAVACIYLHRRHIDCTHTLLLELVTWTTFSVVLY